MKNLNLAVLASTSGTDLQAIIDEIKAGTLENVDLKCVIANKECGAMEKARTAGIEDILIESKNKEREEFDRLVSAELEKRDVELVVLVGYMRYLSKWFVDKYENRIMNIHPSLLPKFAGGMDLNVHEEVLKAREKVTGCTIHFVDEGTDTGPIILQREVEIAENETADTLKEKVQALEKTAYPEAIRLYRDGKLKVQEGTVHILE